MKKIFVPFILLVLLVSLILPVALGKDKIVIKAGHVATTTNPYHLGLVYFANKVKEKTSGQVEVKVFPSSQLGNERDLIEGLQMGSVEMAVISNAVFGTIKPEAMLFDLPFIFRDDQHCFKVVDGPIGQKIKNLFPQVGIRILSYIDAGFRYPYIRNGSIKKPSDLNGLKIRVMENPIHIGLYKAFGARAVPMAAGETYTAMQQGVIDGSDNPLVFYSSMGHWEVAKNITINLPLLKNVATYTISETFYKSLPKKIQRVIYESAMEAAIYERKVFAEQEKQLLSELKGKGVVISYPDNVESFQEIAKTVWKEFENKVGKKQIKAVLATK